jgi:NADPH:quinone reductase-like Zn-dependent oxidoreductase
VKAVVLDEFGGPEVLHIAEVPLPEPGPGQIRVKVHAAAINRYDSKVRSGAMERFFSTPLPAVIGFELAGTVDALGPDVTGVGVGDRVAGWSNGSIGAYAEYTLSKVFARIPDELDFDAAATLPTAGETATRTLDAVGVRSGDTVLIHGASGSVGEMATQLAILRGATVIGTVGAQSQERVRALGAIATTYGEGLVERVRALAPNGIDAVIDTTGRDVLPDSIELRGGTDRIVTIADTSASGLGVTYTSKSDRAGFDLAGLAALRASGQVTTTIAATFPFEEASKAHELSDTGHAGGKVILVP